MISMIYAMDKNNLIGKNNDLPWHIPEDLKYFYETTKNHTVVMGRKTFEGVIEHTKKPFSHRKNVVATRSDLKYPGVEFIHDLDNYLKKVEESDEEIFIIGGKAIYESALKYADRIYVTYILDEYDGDTYLNLDLSDFELVSKKKKSKLIFAIYERRDKK